MVKDHLLENGFQYSQSDHCVFFKKVSGNSVYFAVYVDDMLIFGKTREIVVQMKEMIKQKFKVDDRGEVDFILGMKVQRDRERKLLKINHQRYINELMSTYGFEESREKDLTPVPHNFKFHVHKKGVEEGEAIRIDEYRSIMGSLTYLAHWSRPDILYAVSNLASNCSYPNQKDWEGVTLRHPTSQS
jgi:hypothetical protein